MERTERKLVYAMCVDPAPPNAQNDKHGRGIPTRYKIRYSGNRWYRVMRDADLVYISVEKRRIMVDAETEYRLEQL